MFVLMVNLPCISELKYAVNRPMHAKMRVSFKGLPIDLDSRSKFSRGMNTKKKRMISNILNQN